MKNNYEFVYFIVTGINYYRRGLIDEYYVDLLAPYAVNSYLQAIQLYR
jgi:hypothetical protein